MSVPLPVWIATAVFIIALLLFDFVFHVRQTHTPTLREAAIWSSVYVGIAIAFGIGVVLLGGPGWGGEYFAGYITEKALSVDNLFVFLIIMSSFQVPRVAQQKALLFGIVFALIARTAFIFLGAAAIARFAWVFYLFGLILLYTAGHMLKPQHEDSGAADNVMVRLVQRVVPATDRYDGDRLTTMVDGRKVLTPMLMVMLAIGGTDILFALDSVPAIYGLTQNVYLVFTATAFSLLGLRQLYFLIDGLLDRLIYLKYGLSAILAFIGVKLILHALHENNLGIINEGQPVQVVEVSTALSLSVIIGVLTLTVLLSLLSGRGRAMTRAASANRLARQYLSTHFHVGADEREELYAKLTAEEARVRAIPDPWQGEIAESTLYLLLEKAHRQHEAVGHTANRAPGVRSADFDEDALAAVTVEEEPPADRIEPTGGRH